MISALLLCSVSFSCEKDGVLTIDSFLRSLDTTEYYDQEFLHRDYQYIYGIWKLYEISGGIHGAGYEPDFDYLELKPYGIYGLIREDHVFEYGKIELLAEPLGRPGVLPIKFEAEHYSSENQYFASSFNIQRVDHPEDTLNMNTGFPDGYSYHFQRVK